MNGSCFAIVVFLETGLANHFSPHDLFDCRQLLILQHNFHKPILSCCCSLTLDSAKGTRSFCPESCSPREPFCPYSLSPRVVSPSFINSALKNEIWKIPLQIFIFWMLSGLFMGTLFLSSS